MLHRQNPLLATLIHHPLCHCPFYLAEGHGPIGQHLAMHYLESAGLATRPTKMGDYLDLIRFDKPIGWLLLLWPTFWGLWIAGEGYPDLLLIFVFGGGVFLMRSAGCVINDLADRNFDPHVARTQNRPIASGRVSVGEALVLFAVLMLMAFGLVLLTNRLTVYLALAAALMASLYPFLKRWTYLPQVWLGMAFGWGIPMAFAAQTGEIPNVAWLLFVANVFWTTAYDTQYAMVDRDDDLRIGVKSTAILFGDFDRGAISILQTSFLACIALAFIQLEFSYFAWAGLGIATLTCIWQLVLIRMQYPAECFKAFRINNFTGMAIFAGLIAHYLLS